VAALPPKHIDRSRGRAGCSDTTQAPCSDASGSDRCVKKAPLADGQNIVGRAIGQAIRGLRGRAPRGSLRLPLAAMTTDPHRGGHSAGRSAGASGPLSCCGCIGGYWTGGPSVRTANRESRFFAHIPGCSSHCHTRAAVAGAWLRPRPGDDRCCSWSTATSTASRRPATSYPAEGWIDAVLAGAIRRPWHRSDHRHLGRHRAASLDAADLVGRRQGIEAEVIEPLAPSGRGGGGGGKKPPTGGDSGPAPVGARM